MATSTPTSADIEKATAYAEYCAPCSLRYGPPIDDEGILALSRCYLALRLEFKQQTIELERVRAELVQKLAGVRFGQVDGALAEALSRAERAEALNGRLVDALCAQVGNRYAGPG